MPNRKRSSAVYLGGYIALSAIGSVLYPTDNKHTTPTANAEEKTIETRQALRSFDYADLTLEDYRYKPTKTRHEIVKNYVDSKAMPAALNDGMYACLSEHSFTKSTKLKLGEVLGWCFSDYEKSPTSLNNKINLDVFQDNFSLWDGSYRPLEKLVKANMHNDSSYDHVSTTYHLMLGKNPQAIVKTTFKGTNAYGAVVKQVVSARVDVKTGEIINLVDD
ncbi:hypothetical protein [Dickeya oryzae]|uniref:hypothetical protein n=1 Tax=Dickeya oryzae TaxID=1240404 RepID=UPI001FEF756D|nr:hypothetical protein [Dickeya oryzae]